MKELYTKAVNRLLGIGPSKFKKLIQVEIDGAGGILHPDAAACLAADRLGITTSTNKMKCGDTSWVYTFIATINCADLRRNQDE